MELKRILTAAIVAVMSLGIFGMGVANAAGTYKISCKNDAYGMHLGSDYTAVAYVYDANRTNGGVSADDTEYLITGSEAYVGNDCIYAGSGDTNGTAVVAADVARIAINAIVGAVTNRIDMAYAAANSGASATGLSFTTQSDGFSMSANKLVGGLSFWADYGNNNMENTQLFTNVRLDSMKFDGNASSYSIGVDKTFGKALIGIVVSNLDTDITTTFNSGTYKQDVSTYGVYLAYKTSMLQLDLGIGQGDSDITTTRKDLGNDSVINGSTTADIEYTHARIAANFNRGRFTLVPSASYRTLDMDIAAFTDDRGDESLATMTGAGYLFSAGEGAVADANAYALGVTDDTIAKNNVTTETISLGMMLSANYGKMVPYLDFSYDSEDTSAANYKLEVGTDGNTETKATDYTDSLRIGAGINFMLGSHITGGIRAGQVSGREDWTENYVAGNISIGF